MRTNIDIDDKLMSEAMKVSKLEHKTKKAVIQEALEMMVRATRRDAILKLRGKLRWEGDLNDSRTSKHGDRPASGRRKAA